MPDPNAVSAAPTPQSPSLFMDPAIVTQYFNLQPGMNVADFGVGPGHFTIVIAQIVGPDGRVAAVDVQFEKLDHLKARSDAEGLKNVDFIRADLEELNGTGILAETQDFVLIANVLYESKQKEKILAETSRVLKPGGLLAVIDWQKGVSGLGPADQLRMDAQAMQSLVENAGFIFQQAVETDNFHYGFIFQK